MTPQMIYVICVIYEPGPLFAVRLPINDPSKMAPIINRTAILPFPIATANTEYRGTHFLCLMLPDKMYDTSFYMARNSKNGPAKIHRPWSDRRHL